MSVESRAGELVIDVVTGSEGGYSAHRLTDVNVGPDYLLSVFVRDVVGCYYGPMIALDANGSYAWVNIDASTTSRKLRIATSWKNDVVSPVDLGDIQVSRIDVIRTNDRYIVVVNDAVRAEFTHARLVDGRPEGLPGAQVGLRSWTCADREAEYVYSGLELRQPV